MNQVDDFSVVQKGQYVILKPGDLIVQVYGVATERGQCIDFISGFLKGTKSWLDSFREKVFPCLKILVPCMLGTEGHDLGNYFEVNFSNNRGDIVGGNKDRSDQIWQDFHLANQNENILVACMLFPMSMRQSINPLLYAEIMKAIMVSHYESNKRVYFGYSSLVPQASEFRVLIESAQKNSKEKNIYLTENAYSFGVLMAGVFGQKLAHKLPDI